MVEEAANGRNVLIVSRGGGLRAAQPTSKEGPRLWNGLLSKGSL